MAGKSDVKIVERIISDLKSYSIDYFIKISSCYRPRGKSLHDSYLTQMQKQRWKEKVVVAGSNMIETHHFGL